MKRILFIVFFIFALMNLFSNKTLLTGGSILLLLLAVFYISSWDRIDWKILHPDNLKIVRIAVFCTAFYLLSMSVILFVCRAEITDSRVGRLLLLSLSLFFIVRFGLEILLPGGDFALACLLLFLALLFAYPVIRRKSQG